MSAAPAHFVLDPAEGGRFVHVSNGLCRFLGRGRDELQSWRLSDWAPELDPPRLQGLWNELRASGSARLHLHWRSDTIAVTLEHFTFAGREQVSGILHAPAGGPCASGDGAGDSQCLHDRRFTGSRANTFEVNAGTPAEPCAVRERLSLVEFALDQVPDAVYLADENGNFRYANHSASRALGFSQAELLALNISAIDPDLCGDGWSRLQERLRSHGSTLREALHRSRDGEMFPVEVSASRFHFDGTAYVLFVARDCIDRKRLETRLLQSERFHRTLMENFPDFIVRMDAECRYVYVSPAVLSFWDESEEFFLGRTACEIDLLHDAKSSEQLLENARRAIAIASPASVELQAEFSGERHVLEIRHIPELDEKGRVLSVIGTIRNITEPRRRQRQEEKRLGIFRAMALGAGLTETLNRVVSYVESIVPDVHARIMLVGEDGASLFPGSSSLGLFAAKATPAVHRSGPCADAVRYGRTAVAEDIATHADWQYGREEALNAGFRSCWSEPVFDVQGQVIGAFELYRSVSGAPTAEVRQEIRKACQLAAIAIGRHRLQQERDERERQFRAVSDNAPSVIVRYDRQCRRIYFNKMLERFAGPEAHRILGHTPLEYPGSLGPIAAEYQAQIVKVFETGEPVELESEWIKPDGTATYGILRFVPERDTQGEVVTVLVVSNDLTERRRAEKALEANEQLFRSLVENSPDAIVRYDRDFRRLYLNPSARRLFELIDDQVLGATPLNGSPVMSVPSFMDNLRQVRETGVPMTVEMGCRRPNGQELWGHVCFVPEMDGNGRIASILVIGRNATEFINSRRELAASRTLLRDLRARGEAAREEERKRISRELHDELGQLLTSLRLNISLLRMRHAGESPGLDRAAAECIDVVDTSIKAVRGIASALRPLALDMGLTAAIKWQLEQFAELTGVAVELTHHADDISPSESQSLLIFRILQESLTNVARHAQAHLVRVHLDRDGTCYLLNVSDDGKGFDMSAAPRGGTLGILGMHERALAAGAELSVSSTPGAGTELTLSVPCTGESGIS